MYSLRRRESVLGLSAAVGGGEVIPACPEAEEREVPNEDDCLG